MASKGWDRWDGLDTRGDITTDETFVPLRAPRVEGEPVAVDPTIVEVAPGAYMRRDDVKPGMRLIGGRWFYSAAWL